MKKWVGALSIFALSYLGSGCAKQAVTPSESSAEVGSPAGDDQRTSVPGVPRVSGDARGHLGEVVEVRGSVVRAKLGDLVQAEGFSVYCTGQRLPDALIGQVVTVRGKLAERDTGARETPDGAISQGTAPGTRSLVIASCALVP